MKRKWISILVLLSILLLAVPASAHGVVPNYRQLPVPRPPSTLTPSPTAMPSVTPSPTYTPSVTPTRGPGRTPRPTGIPSMTPPPMPSMTPPPIPTVPAIARIKVIQGKVSAISDTSITVKGRDIKLTSDTVFVPSVPSVGDLVAVVAKVESNSNALAPFGRSKSLTALTVTIILQAGRIRPVPITGIIQAVTDSSITVRDQVVEIDASTVISGALEVGLLAHATVVQQGATLHALAIVTMDRGEEASHAAFAGVIDRIVNDQEWIVSGITVTMDALTQISGKVPSPGDVATVEGISTARDAVLAAKIIVSSLEDTATVFEGKIQSLGEGEWIIAGRAVKINADTIIDESEGTAQEGMDALVVAIPQPDGSLLATYIRIERP